ncbi:MAG: AcrR family transcriptional regulator [Candidatus Azotimanducaceae bacterium]|jgi:AcrR family transcriptional regulator
MQDIKQNYHHGALKESLLAAGDAVLIEKGFKGFTLRECARRAGVSHAAPKHHFGDVTGFLTELAAIGFDRLTNELRSGISKAKNLDDEFIATTKSYLKFAEDYPEHFRIMFRHDLLNPDSTVLGLAARKTFTVLTNVILRQRGEAELTVGEFNDAPMLEELIYDIVIGWSHIHGFAHLKLEKQFPIVAKSMEKRIMKNTSSRLAQLIRRDAAAKSE